MQRPTIFNAAVLLTRKRWFAFGLSIRRCFRNRSFWLRFAKITAIVSVSFLVVLNIGLNLGVTRPILSRLISPNPQSFMLDYRRAWSVWPAFVRVSSLRVRGNDDNVQWQLDIAEARVSIDVLALLRREFHATRVRARGISFRLRQKVEVAAGTKVRLAALPSIAGFDGPPLRAPPSPAYPLDTEYVPWSVLIENVDGLAHQLWIDEFHFEGSVQVSGSFYLWPKRRLWIGPAHASILSGAVRLGDEPLLERVSGAAGCQVPMFDPMPPVGIEFFRFFSGSIRLDAEIPSARAFNYYSGLHGGSPLFDRGRGTFHLDAGLRFGVARPLDLKLILRDLTMQAGGWLALGTVEFSLRTNSEGPGALAVRMAPIELFEAGAKVAAVHAKQLHLGAGLDAVDLSRPMPTLLIRGELPDVEVPSLKLVNQFIPDASGLRFKGGSASLSTAFIADTATRSAQGEVTAEAVHVTADDGALRFGGQLKFGAQFAKLQLDSGNVDLSHVVLDIRDVTLRDSHASIANWWGGVTSREATIRPSHRAPLDVNFAAKFENATPILAFSKRAPALPGWVTRVLLGGECNATGRLLAGTGYVELSNLQARTGLLKVEGSLRQHHEIESGVFRITSGPLSVGMELNNGDTKLIFVGSPVLPTLASVN